MGDKARRSHFGIVAGAAACAAALLGTVPAPAQAPSPGDAAVVANALAAINGGNAAAALALRGRTQDAAARKLIAWYAFSRREAGRATGVDFAEATAFHRENPHWPLMDSVARAADRAIAPQTPAAALLAWFANRLPETGDGMLDAVAALKAQGKPQEALDLLRRSWARLKLTDTEEAEILRRHGAELRAEDHAARIGHLNALGQKRLAAALQARVTFDAPSAATVDARFKLRDDTLRYRPAIVEAALASVPAAEKAKEGFLYDLMRWHRRGNRAAQALAAAAAMPARLEDPEHVWKEFDILIRNAIAARQYEAAYRLASRHRQSEGERFAEAEFLAGFIALRFLKQPTLAERHFQAAARATSGGWDIARLAYWRGRLAEAGNDKAKAAEHYAAAARYAGTFYGQLAAPRVGRRTMALDANTGSAAPEKFWGDEIVRAAHLLRAAGDGRTARLFAIRAAWNGGWTLAQQAYLGKFVLDLTGPAYREQTAVRMAKLAMRDGASITATGFPTLDLPVANTIEPALVYAVIRQESEFLPGARSHAGARGLMQLMPFTAKTEATEAKLPYVLNRLTADPAYNLRLGTQHLQRLSDYYQGSYPLMVAAYNAGAGRVDRWLAVHGDPRKGQTEWAEWIELIPFEETRLYTKYVLENHAIYRVRLGDAVDLARLSSHWQAPRASPEACGLMMSRDIANLPPMPLSGPGDVPSGDAPGTPSPKAPGAKPDPKKKNDAIPLVKKEKPDNVAGSPAC